MKDFLYLVQARARLAEKHLSLASDRADVLIYTFDKKIDKPNFLYKSNTSWAEGRNLLVEAARKSSKSYKYYILLDDDIDFTKGSFKEFEDEVLSVNPDLSVPVYRDKRAIRYLSNYSPFRYSILVDWDCCFVCVTKELLFGNKLFPYPLEVNGISCNHNYYCSWKFWFDVFENYSERKLLVFNKIHIKNILGGHDWSDEALCYPELLTQLTNGKKSKMEKAMPYLFLEDKKMHMRRRYPKLSDFLKGNKSSGLDKVRHILEYFSKRRLCLNIVLIYLTLLALAKDVKLNWQIRRENISKA